MKIFYWLHRRLYTDGEYCRVPHHNKDAYVNDSGSAHHGVRIRKAGTEKEALLLDPSVASLQDVLDGILTIGTLGYLDGHCHHLGSLRSAADIPPGFPSDVSAFEKEVEGMAVELAPAAEHPNHSMAIESFRKEMMPTEEDVKNISQVESIADEEEGLLEPLLGEIAQVDKRERVTLADLLAADHLPAEKSDTTSHAAPASAETAFGKVTNDASKVTVISTSLSSSTKHGLPLNKKLVPWKKEKEHSPPATGKLHQRIRRMLKKKIHPEMAHDMQPHGEEQGSDGKSADEPVCLI